MISRGPSGVNATAIATTLVLSVAGLVAQGPILSRGAPMMLRGEIVEISCYRQKGVAEGTGAAHVACAKDCAAKGGALGILSDGDGLFKIVGDLTKDRHAKLVPFLGQTVEVTGAEVVISNTYDVRSFEVLKIARTKK